jgi:uncharacterized integral membrane protein
MRQPFFMALTCKGAGELMTKGDHFWEELAMRWKLYLSFILLLSILTFVVQNTETVTFNFLFWTIGLPGALLLLVVFIIGVATGMLLVAGKNPRQSKAIGFKKENPQKTDLQGKGL